MRKILILAFAALLAAGSSSLLAQSVTSALRGATPLNEEGPAPRMTPLRNTTEREQRNYPEQPPLIPHSIDGYQVDMNGNKADLLPAPVITKEQASDQTLWGNQVK